VWRGGGINRFLLLIGPTPPGRSFWTEFSIAIGFAGMAIMTEHTRADALGDGLDHTALAGGVAPFKDHDHPQPLVLDPSLQRAQLALQAAQCLLVRLALHRLVDGPQPSISLAPLSSA
jgi:hypothetical protein